MFGTTKYDICALYERRGDTDRHVLEIWGFIGDAGANANMRFISGWLYCIRQMKNVFGIGVVSSLSMSI